MNRFTSRISFFTVAAWYCWTAPLLATVAALSIYLKEGPTRYHPLGDPAVDIAFWVCVSGLSLGVASLFGIPKHGTKAILWKAMLGMTVSCLGSLYLFGAIFSRIARQ